MNVKYKMAAVSPSVSTRREAISVTVHKARDCTPTAGHVCVSILGLIRERP